MSPNLPSDRLTNLTLDNLFNQDLTLSAETLALAVSVETLSLADGARNLAFKSMFAEAIGVGCIYTGSDRNIIICTPYENMGAMQEAWDDILVAGHYLCGAKTITYLCEGEVLMTEETRTEVTNFYLWHKIVVNSVNSGSVNFMVATLERAETSVVNQSQAPTETSSDLVELNIVSEKTGEPLEAVKSRLQNSGLSFSRYKGDLLVTPETAAQLIRQWFISKGEQEAQAVFAIAVADPTETEDEEPTEADAPSAANGASPSYAEMEMISEAPANGAKASKARAPRKPSLQARRGFKAPKTTISDRNAAKYLEAALPVDEAKRLKYLNEIQQGTEAAQGFVGRLTEACKNKEAAATIFTKAAGTLLDQMATPAAK